MGVGAPFSQEYRISPLFPSMSLAILGDVYLLIALLVSTPGESSLLAGSVAGLLMLICVVPGNPRIPGKALPFLAGRVRISPNGKLVRC